MHLLSTIYALTLLAAVAAGTAAAFYATLLGLNHLEQAAVRDRIVTRRPAGRGGPRP